MTLIPLYAVLLGYPPREIESYDPGCTLLSLRIRSGETLKLEELPAHKARTKAGVQGAAASQTPQLESELLIKLRGD